MLGTSLLCMPAAMLHAGIILGISCTIFKCYSIYDKLLFSFTLPYFIL